MSRTECTRWDLTGGRVGMAQGFRTCILPANPGQTTASVQITFLRDNGATPARATRLR